MFRAVTGRYEAPPAVKTKAVYIPKYELEWEVLKEFLDRRFIKYNCQFTKRFDVRQDNYVVDLPEDLTANDEAEIAALKTIRV
ncbi:hypothetical protein IQ07DRAFT_642348 [Pyrenochaeta sp. DS3sAY3a]|nr:hypothetical protein IQ07DRAFT_642348 [Pyrenochaeta sp. DS3sAY3a]